MKALDGKKSVDQPGLRVCGALVVVWFGRFSRGCPVVLRV